ncbi:hypothetical protein BH23CHL2_BH23CHL2_17950 [soil metagenome]
MRRIPRSHILAAALLIVGAAGLVFAGTGLRASPNTSASSDDALVKSIGTVPLPLEITPVEPAAEMLNRPDRTDQDVASFDGNSYDGKLTTGRDADLSDIVPPPSPIPTPPEGGTAGGTRQESASGINPVVLRIPKIGVDAAIVHVGTTSSGAMEAPSRYLDVGWWSPGAQPGERGRAVLAGHVDSPWGPSVFINLDELVLGDEIIVGNGESELRYIVRGSAVYRTDAAPVEQIFGPSVERELVLITCGGWFDRRTASYLHRRVIFAVLAEDDLNPPAEPDNASS